MDHPQHDRSASSILNTITTTTDSTTYTNPSLHRHPAPGRFATNPETEVVAAEGDQVTALATTSTTTPAATTTSPPRYSQNKIEYESGRSNASRPSSAGSSHKHDFDPEIATPDWQIYRDPSAITFTAQISESDPATSAAQVGWTGRERRAAAAATDLPPHDPHHGDIDDGEDDSGTSGDNTPAAIITPSPNAGPAIKRMVQRMGRTLNEVFAEERYLSTASQGVVGVVPSPVSGAAAVGGAVGSGGGSRDVSQAAMIEKLQRRYAELSVVEEGVGGVMTTAGDEEEGVRLEDFGDDDHSSGEENENHDYSSASRFDTEEEHTQTNPYRTPAMPSSNTTTALPVSLDIVQPVNSQPPSFLAAASTSAPTDSTATTHQCDPNEATSDTTLNPSTSFAARMRRILSKRSAARARGREEQRQRQQQQQRHHMLVSEQRHEHTQGRGHTYQDANTAVEDDSNGDAGIDVHARREIQEPPPHLPAGPGSVTGPDTRPRKRVRF